MWLIPRNSRFSAFALDTKVLDWGSDECFQTCESSLIRRSKNMRAQSWRRAWNRGSLTLHRFGRILKPSQEKHFVERYTSSLEGIHAKDFPTQDCDEGRTTPDTFSRILQRSCEQFSLFGASSRMSPDTCPLDSPPFIEAYEIWTTKLRQDCLLRANAVRPTNGSGCSSWPTAQAHDATGQRGNTEADHHYYPHDLSNAVNWPTHTVNSQAQTADTPTPGQTGGTTLEGMVRMFPSPAAANYRDGKASPATMARNSRPLQEFIVSGPPDPASPSTNGKNPGLLWRTPVPQEPGITTERLEGELGSRMYDKETGVNKTIGLSQQIKMGGQIGKGKLNPLWVSQLMGVPVGWCDPESTSCDCWATASSPPRRSSPGEP